MLCKPPLQAFLDSADETRKGMASTILDTKPIDMEEVYFDESEYLMNGAIQFSKQATKLQSRRGAVLCLLRVLCCPCFLICGCIEMYEDHKKKPYTEAAVRKLARSKVHKRDTEKAQLIVNKHEKLRAEATVHIASLKTAVEHLESETEALSEQRIALFEKTSALVQMLRNKQQDANACLRAAAAAAEDEVDLHEEAQEAVVARRASAAVLRRGTYQASLQAEVEAAKQRWVVREQSTTASSSFAVMLSQVEAAGEAYVSYVLCPGGGDSAAVSEEDLVQAKETIAAVDQHMLQLPTLLEELQGKQRDNMKQHGELLQTAAQEKVALDLEKEKYTSFVQAFDVKQDNLRDKQRELADWESVFSGACGLGWDGVARELQRECEIKTDCCC